MFAKKPPFRLPTLGPLENAVMHVLRERGNAMADEVRQSFEKTRTVKDSTVRTLLKRLEENSDCFEVREVVRMRCFCRKRVPKTVAQWHKAKTAVPLVRRLL